VSSGDGPDEAAGEGGGAGGRGAEGAADAQGAAAKGGFFRLEAAARDLVPGEPVEVTGVVRDAATGEPVAAIDVMFKHRIGEATATSGPDGRFRTELSPGTYRVRALGDGYVAPSQELAIGGATGSRALEIEVVRLARVTGRVVGADRAPVAGASVKFIPERVSDRDYLRTEELPSSTQTGADGRFELDVTPGTVILEAVANGVLASIRVPAAAPGRAVDVVIELPAAAVISGVVRDASGRGVAGAEVLASSRAPGHPRRHQVKVTSGEGGRFRVEAISPGPASVEARAGSAGAAAPVQIELAPGREARVELVLAEGQVVAGRVVRSDGLAMPDVTVTARRRGSRMPVTTTSGADGAFRLAGLEPGTFTVVAEADDYAAARIEVAPPVEDVALTLRAMGGARGRVTGAGGGALHDFRVELISGRSAGGAEIPTRRAPGRRFRSPDGAFELYPLEPGHYQIRISADGHAPAELEVEVPEAGWGEASAELASGAVVAGVVTTDGGAPVAGARVAIERTGGKLSTYTDGAGRFQLEGVAPGRRALEVTHAEHVGVARALQVAAGRNQADVVLSAGAAAPGEGEELVVEGAGVYLVARDGVVQIFRVVSKSPAARSGLRRGDRVVAIDGVEVAGMSPLEVAQRLRGAPGTRVLLQVERRGQVLAFEVARARVRSAVNPWALLAGHCGRVAPEPIS